jgi:hypothetical protein
MLGVIMKTLPAMVAAGGIYTSMQETNPLIDYAKVAMTQYEISTISRFIVYNAVGKNKVPTPQNFRQYLRETMQSSRDPSLDYWDQPYILLRKGKTFTVISSGPDKKRGTADDIKQEISVPF